MKRILLSICCLLTVVQITFAQGVAVPNRPNRPQPKVKLNVSLPKVNFQDIAAKAGLLAPNVSGPERDKKYIIETIGSGVALLDYDNDGWPDIYLACEFEAEHSLSQRGQWHVHRHRHFVRHGGQRRQAGASRDGRSGGRLRSRWLD